MDPQEDKKLKQIKKNIEMAHAWFEDNYKSFNEMREFVFVTSTSADDAALNRTLQRPTVECNIMEAYISRLRGEFSKNVPGILVSSDDMMQASSDMIDLIERHMRDIFFEANKDGLEYACYSDTLSGGFSAIKVSTEYNGEKSFDQSIKIERVYDPTLTYWDPMARTPNKLDGRFCGENIPLTREEFQDQFPNVELPKNSNDVYPDSVSRKQKVKASKTIGNFRWSYKTQKEDIVLISDYYEKDSKREKIVKLSNGVVMTSKEYRKFTDKWLLSGRIEQPPIPVGEPRMTNLTTIKRYRICESQILEETETDYANLPIIFIDGNSVLNKDRDNNQVKQVTRAIVHQGRGTQRVINYLMQAFVNEVENMPQHKWMVPKEGIPEQYKEAYVNVQTASVLVYNAFKDDDPQIPIPPPQAVPRLPIPPEILHGFTVCSNLMQTILGSFDQNMAKLDKNAISGRAIEESVSLSNGSAMPYVVNFLKGIQAVATEILELLPKIYKTPRTIPVRDVEGKRDYVVINSDGRMTFDYEKNALQVKVEGGPSFGAQKAQALTQITQLSHANPGFGQFINDKGLSVVIDNMDIRNVEQLKEKAVEWEQEMAQRKEQPPPEQMDQQIEQQKIQQKDQQMKMEAQLKMMQMQLEEQKMELEKVSIMAKLAETKMKSQMSLDQTQTDKITKAAEIAIKRMDGDRKFKIESMKLEKQDRLAKDKADKDKTD